MTVLNELSKIAYIGDSSQTLYPIPFEYINVDNIHVSVYTKQNEFVEEWTYSNQYIIEKSNVKVLSGFEIDNTKKLLIIRVVDAVQDNRYREGGDFPAKSTETSFDKLTMLIQQHQEVLDRCVKVEVLDNQTPEELLTEVYSKLDSATDIAKDAISAAEQAQTAADNATSAVTSAEQTLVQTQAYVDAAKVEINNVKDTATSSISTTTESAKSDIAKTVTEAKADINGAIDEATTNISNIVSNAEGEVANIAITEANKAISNAAQEATDLVNAYINSEIKPQLDEATASASGSATSASSSAIAAQNSANQASSSATSASSSATSAANSATAAAKSAASINTSNLVDLTSNQTIAGTKTFTSHIYQQAESPRMIVRDMTLTRGQAGDGGDAKFQVTDKNNLTLGELRVYLESDGGTSTCIGTASVDSSGNQIHKTGLRHTVHTNGTSEVSLTSTDVVYTPTPTIGSGGKQTINAEWFNSKHQVVTSLPSSPTAGVFYFIEDDIPPQVANYDYVVDYKAPTSSDPTWYRVYKSGWVEQGGTYKIETTGQGTITFKKPMKDTNYSFIMNKESSDASSWTVMEKSNTRSTSSVGIQANLTGYVLVGSFVVSGQGV